jgi:hypothetical protein
MKNVQLTLNVDPMYFGSLDDKKTEAFAFNLNRNIEKIFMVKSDYSLIQTGNTYRVHSSDPILELEISEYIENNWHTKKLKR